MTTLPPSLARNDGRVIVGREIEKPRQAGLSGQIVLAGLERETRLELATPTLARSCSTN